MQHIHNDIIHQGDVRATRGGEGKQKEQGTHQDKNVPLLMCSSFSTFGVIEHNLHQPFNWFI